MYFPLILSPIIPPVIRCGCRRVGDAPLRLLRVRGLELIPLPDAEQRRGFGGTFAVKNADTSMAMLGDKLRARAGDTRRGLCRRRHPSCTWAGRSIASVWGYAPCTLPKFLPQPRGRMSDQKTKPKPTSVLIGLEPNFEQNAPAVLANTQLRRNMGKATQTIRGKRANVVGNAHLEELREAGRAI